MVNDPVDQMLTLLRELTDAIEAYRNISKEDDSEYIEELIRAREYLNWIDDKE